MLQPLLSRWWLRWGLSAKKRAGSEKVFPSGRPPDAGGRRSRGQAIPGVEGRAGHSRSGLWRKVEDEGRGSGLVDGENEQCTRSLQGGGAWVAMAPVAEHETAWAREAH